MNRVLLPVISFISPCYDKIYFATPRSDSDLNPGTNAMIKYIIAPPERDTNTGTDSKAKGAWRKWTKRIVMVYPGQRAILDCIQHYANKAYNAIRYNVLLYNIIPGSSLHY
ncbi:MAG: hypothetical protein GX876_00105 [Bacteroidales bacterium]|nr:hypothetical protein [Bacteroidales bacterium]